VVICQNVVCCSTNAGGKGLNAMWRRGIPFTFFLPRRRRATIKDGKIATCQSQILSKGADMVVYAADPALVEGSKGSFESK